MNIQNFISQVRKAKNLRVLNYFHQSPRSGVDVKQEDFIEVMLLLKNILKFYKSKNCDIGVSFYGEIYISINGTGHAFELSISNAPSSIKIKAIEASLDRIDFAKMSHFGSVSSLMVSVKTLRKKSHWKHYCASDFNMDATLIADNIYKDLLQRVRYYSYTINEEHYLNQVTKEDKLAAIHCGGALLGKSSMLFHLSKSLQDKIYVNDISITNNEIIISDHSNRDVHVHFYGTTEDKFFRKYLCCY